MEPWLFLVWVESSQAEPLVQASGWERKSMEPSNVRGFSSRSWYRCSSKISNGSYHLLITPFGSVAHIALKELEALSRHEASQAGAGRRQIQVWQVSSVSRTIAIKQREREGYVCIYIYTERERESNYTISINMLYKYWRKVLLCPPLIGANIHDFRGWKPFRRLILWATEVRFMFFLNHIRGCTDHNCPNTGLAVKHEGTYRQELQRKSIVMFCMIW